MKVRKRSGRLANLDNANIRKQTQPACAGLDADFEVLEMNANLSFVDGMETTQIQEILIQSALNLIDVDKPDFNFVAARLALFNLYHAVGKTYKKSKVNEEIYTHISLQEYIEKNKEILSYDSSLFDLNELNKEINPKNDYMLTYLGVDTLIKRYLLKQNNEVTELPQHMFMSLAMFVAQKEGNPTKWAKKFYSVISNLEFLMGTPTLSNGRTKSGNCFSCAVGSMPDNLEGIMDAFKEIALGSKFGSGWGYDITKLRALGGKIGDIQGAANGIVPNMKVLNDLLIYIDQLGVRMGALTAYCETWHKDFIDFLDTKKNSGDEKRRCKELFIGASCSDLFMNRVKNNQMFTMFDPYDVPELPDLFGVEFEEKYLEYENAFKNGTKEFTNTPVEVNAKDIWKKLQKYYWETGMPNLFFKDNANNQHENKEEGIIRSTNLCTEIFQPTSPDKTILCNIGSINLAKVNSKEDFERVIPIAGRILDNVIDVTTYPIPGTEETQKRTRAIGLGVCGEAELLAKEQIMYGSQEHKEFIDNLYKNFAECSDNTSIELAKERGPWKEGEIHRNGYRRAIAPTSTIAILMATTPTQEAVFAPVWIEENKMGNYKMTAPNLSSDTFQYYISPYDVDQMDAVECNAIRQKYIDQGISFNLYFRPGVSGKVVFDTIMLAWERGLKSTYYLRSEGKKAEVEIKTDKIACVGCAG